MPSSSHPCSTCCTVQTCCSVEIKPRVLSLFSCGEQIGDGMLTDSFEIKGRSDVRVGAMYVEDFKMPNLAGDVGSSKGLLTNFLHDDRSMVQAVNYSRDLPVHVIEDTVNRVEDAKYITRVQLLGKDWQDAGKNVRSLRGDVFNAYHKRARDNSSAKSLESDGAGHSTSGYLQPKSGGSWYKPFKVMFVSIVKDKRCIVQLRIEVEEKLQSKTVPEGGRLRMDFWLADPWFLRQSLPGLGSIPPHLSIIDFREQAIMSRSKIIETLSKCCKALKTSDLRNMYIDTADCEEMNLLASLTLRCVKVVGGALQHINDNMSKLQTLALLGVFGADGGVLAFQDMKVLCLGLSTPAKDVEMDLPKLEKLQLKMKCPDKLIICASVLKYVAFNLEVLEPSEADLRSMEGLRMFFYGATSFATVSDLVSKNYLHLERIFLDIPCMALGEDGRFLGVLEGISLRLPSFSKLHQCEDGRFLGVLEGISLRLPSFSKLHQCEDGRFLGVLEGISLRLPSFSKLHPCEDGRFLGVLKPSKVDLRSIKLIDGLREPLYCARSFTTLSDLAIKNHLHFERIFLDIPCKALGEDGRFLGVLEGILLRLRSFSKLHQCEKLTVLNMDKWLLGFDINKGGSKASSSGSLNFRDIYISLVLFHGSYVWIKFRDVAPKGVYPLPIGRLTGKHKYQPRFKPPREKGVGSAKSQKFDWIYLGQYNTRYEAEVVYHIVAYYYGKAEGQLDLGDGSFFTIPSIEVDLGDGFFFTIPPNPPMKKGDESPICGMAKVKLVKKQVMEVYEDFKAKKAARNLVPTSSEAEMPKEDGQVNMEGCMDNQGRYLTSLQSPQHFFPNQTLEVGENIATQAQFAQLGSNTDSQLGWYQNLCFQVQQVQQHISGLQQQILELQQQQRLDQQEIQESKLERVQLRQQISDILESHQQQHHHQELQEFDTQFDGFFLNHV